MKTKNYQLDLMYQGQEHKDVVYNEAILKIDATLNLNVINFVENLPETISYGERYIITAGPNKNKICYFAHPSKGVQYISPHNNMLIYLIKDNCFIKFSGDEWQKIVINSGSRKISPELRFTGIRDDFVLPKENDCHYLYLEARANISFDQVDSASVTIVIKQNHAAVFEVEWGAKILWPDRKVAQVTATANAIDLFRFHKLPESTHFIAESVTQNYQY